MNEDDKFKITIRIADVPEFRMNIRRNEEEFYRLAVKEIQKLWSDWKLALKDSDSNKIMTVIALRYAKQFYAALEQIKANDKEYEESLENTNELLEDFEQQLDKILLEIK